MRPHPTAGAAQQLGIGAPTCRLDHTSIPHGLLFVTTTPLIMTVAALVMRVPISRGEVLGAIGGFVGMVLLCLDTASDKEVRSELVWHISVAVGLACAF